jgi:hypothetical protein
MKAIILIAVLALCAQASTLSFSAYHLGFTEQLGLDPAQLQDASACFTAGQTVVKQLQDIIVAVKNGQAEKTLLTVADLVAEAHTTLVDDCAIYRADLLTLLAQNTNGTDLKTFAQKHFYTYPTQVIQQATFWLQQFLSGDEYQAGKTEAYLLQILFGLEQPEVLPMPDFNYTDYVPMDFEKFVTEYYQGYLTTLGFTNQTEIDTLARCNGAYMKATNALSALPYSLNNGTLIKVQAISKAVALFAETVETCVDAWRVREPILKKAWDAYTFWPVLSTIQVAFNIGENLPKLVQNIATASVDAMTGNYYEAGVAQAEGFQTILSHVVNVTAIIQNN